jgi:AraC-like DNA-binding protein
MVIYREFRPSPQLRSIVDRLWWLEGSSEEIAADPIPPDGHTEIIVHAAEPFAQRERDETWRVQERFLLAGQATRAVHVEPRGYARMVGARLKPVGAHALFGLSQGELVDHIADLRDIDHGLACRLRDDVSGREDGEAMIESLDRALQAVMPGITAPCVARRAVGIAIRHRGLVRVADVARQVGVSTRQLERLFNERVGVPPKLFLRILRFQHVLHAPLRRAGHPLGRCRSRQRLLRSVALQSRLSGIRWRVTSGLPRHRRKPGRDVQRHSADVRRRRRGCRVSTRRVELDRVASR